VFDATTNSNNTIELFNNSEERIDATNLSIRIYSNGQTTEGGDHQLNLTGFIEPNAFYVISGSNPSDSSISLKADVKHKENLPYNGNDVIELFYNNTLLDQFGLKGFDINFAPDLTMIRLGERVSYSPSKVYDPFNYIAYIPDAFKYLKNDTHEIKTLEDKKDGIKALLENVDGVTPSGVAVKWSQVAGRSSIDEQEVQKLLGYVPKKQGDPSMRLTVK
jgi:hypothetical protein